MQKRVLKKLPTLFLLLLCGATAAQTSSFRLKTADSLFLARQYTQSLEHYQAVLNNHEYSHAMLLRMAYIEEGLGHVGSALYYLSLYEQQTGDRAATQKMDELATKASLQGYDPADARLFARLYTRHHVYISLALSSVVLLFLTLAWRHRARGHRPVGFAVVTIVFLAALFVHIQVGSQLSRAVVAHPQTFVMAGPSAGAEVLDILSEGHRLDVIGRVDVWVKVKWNESTGFVKETNLRQVRL